MVYLNHINTKIISRPNALGNGSCFFARVELKRSGVKKELELVLNGPGLNKAIRKVRTYFISEGVNLSREYLRENIKQSNKTRNPHYTLG